jgi:hypothetical protein
MRAVWLSTSREIRTDDIVLGFQHVSDAQVFRREFQQRLEQFGLDLRPDKTRLIRFGGFAAADRRRLNEGKPETFDFLGLHSYLWQDQ